MPAGPSSRRRTVLVAAIGVVAAGALGSPGAAASPSPDPGAARASAAPAAAAGVAPKQRPASYDRFIVRYGDPAQAKGKARLAGQKVGLAARAGRRLATGATLVTTDRKLDAAQTTAFLRALKVDPSVRYAEPDKLLTRADDPPTDPGYVTRQWHYRGPAAGEPAGAHLPDAWRQPAGAGNGTIVAVLDTGITYHPDLTPNVVSGYDFVSDPSVAADGNGRDPNPADPGDFCREDASSWHGTHVAGTVAAVRNGDGVVGVAYGGRVQPVRVLGRCGGYISDIADAIVWAAGGNVPGVPTNPYAGQLAKIVNLSLEGPGTCSYTLQLAINVARNRNASVVVAAGNAGDDARFYQPSSCDNVISVAALDRSNHRAFYSNFGPAVDVAAPGGDLSAGPSNGVYSTLNTGSTTPGSPTYAAYMGTSMAAPHVAGTVAIIQGNRKALGKRRLTPAEIEYVIKGTARPNSCSANCGTGALDAYQALLASQSYSP